VANFALGIGTTTAVFVTLDQFLLWVPSGAANPATVRRLEQRFRFGPAHDVSTRSSFS
jgi:hypothetical protein